MTLIGESDDDGAFYDCDHCYDHGCERCDPHYHQYAESLVVGGERDAGLHVNGFELYGAGLDWEDNANQPGWCWRDTNKLLEEMYAQTEEAGRRLNELMFRSSPILAKLGGFETPPTIIPCPYTIDVRLMGVT